MNLEENLQKVVSCLKGRMLLDSEINEIKNNFNTDLWPELLFDLLQKYNIIGQKFSINEEADPTRLGVEMEWMSPIEQIEESYMFEPGISASVKSYLPIGKCLEGTGDPYFIKIINNEIKVFRIPHDSIRNDMLNEDEVEYICDLADLFLFID